MKQEKIIIASEPGASIGYENDTPFLEWGEKILVGDEIFDFIEDSIGIDGILYCIEEGRWVSEGEDYSFSATDRTLFIEACFLDGGVFLLTNKKNPVWVRIPDGVDVRSKDEMVPGAIYLRDFIISRWNKFNDYFGSPVPNNQVFYCYEIKRSEVER